MSRLVTLLKLGLLMSLAVFLGSGSAVFAADEKPAAAKTVSQPAAKPQASAAIPATEVKKPSAPRPAATAESDVVVDEEDLGTDMPEEGPTIDTAPPAPKIPLTAEKKAVIQKATEKLIQDEIKEVGYFEVDHPETGDLINLTLVSVGPEVTQQDEGEYLLKVNFKDKAGTPYAVSIYVDELGKDEYEIADAIVETAGNKPVSNP